MKGFALANRKDFYIVLSRFFSSSSLKRIERLNLGALQIGVARLSESATEMEA